MGLQKRLTGWARPAYVHHCRTCRADLPPSALDRFCSDECRAQWEQLFGSHSPSAAETEAVATEAVATSAVATSAVATEVSEPVSD